MENKQNLDNIIRESIRECLKLNPDFHKSDTLVLTTYQILKQVFIEEKKYVLLEAPTGSGKSVIAYLIHFCYIYVNHKINEEDTINNFGKLNGNLQNTYLLTSSKLLQSQLDGDISRFSFQDYLCMLKGIKNYECKKLTDETKIYHDYSERFCMGMNTFDKEKLDCYSTCGYIQARNEASLKDCTILNYSYFLNVLKNPNNPFFGTRQLTIADEAHLIPDIVLGMYNIELTQYTLNKINKLLNQIEINFGKSLEDTIFDIQIVLGDCYKFFQKANPELIDFKEYLDNLNDLIKSVVAIGGKFTENKVFKEMFDKDLKKLNNDLKFIDNEDYIESLEKRPEDTFIKSENIGHFASEKIGNNLAGSYKIYKHTLYDLSEAELCRKYFLSKVNIGIFMSATLGNIEEYAILMGMKKEEYIGFRLESNFNFSKSPIYLTNSGYLNHANFNNNIDKVIYDAIYICENLHPKEKGIIHTSTFIISNLLKQKVYNKLGGVSNSKRYLFYETSDEKDSCIELMKSDTNTPYIIIGPSLYEGIDLKDNQGRFNIMIKIPYSGMDDYTKKKMQRFPFWYLRQTLEKLVQLIGRTNRHVEDYSTTYLLDSGTSKIIYNIPEFITNRVKNKKL
jgi:ATP-dependent DNA helicase DinG